MTNHWVARLSHSLATPRVEAASHHIDARLALRQRSSIGMLVVTSLLRSLAISTVPCQTSARSPPRSGRQYNR